MPRFAFRAEGDLVEVNDALLLVAAECHFGDQFLSASARTRNNTTINVNMSKNATIWRAAIFRPHSAKEGAVKGGDVIRLERGADFPRGAQYLSTITGDPVEDLGNAHEPQIRHTSAH